MRIERDFIGMFDVAKGLLMLEVVLVHHIVFMRLALSGPVLGAAGNLADYSGVATGLFFMAAGYSFRPVKDLRTYVRRQARELLVPYFLTMAVTVTALTAAHLCLNDFRPQTVTPHLLAFLYGSIQPFELFGKVWVGSVVAMWFLPTLFFSRLFHQALWRFKNPAVTQAGIWGLTAAAAAFPSAERIQLPWFLVQSCAALGLLEAGRLLKARQMLHEKLNWASIGAATLLTVVLRRASLTNAASNVWQFWMLDYLDAVVMGAALLHIYMKTRLPVAGFAEGLAYIGRYSLFFLCAHGTELLVIPWTAPAARALAQLPIPPAVTFSLLFFVRVAFALAGCAFLARSQRLLNKYRRSKL